MTDNASQIITNGDTTQQLTSSNVGLLMNYAIREQYTNPLLSALREIIVNGAESVVEANNGGKVTVDLFDADTDSPYVVIRDYGTGLDQEELTNIYFDVGESSKRGDKKKTGSLGVGSKSPLALNNSYYIRFIKNNVSLHYCIAQTDDMEVAPVPVLIEQKTQTEPNGVEVKFDIPADQIHRAYSYLYMLKSWICDVDIEIDTHGYHCNLYHLDRMVKTTYGAYMHRTPCKSIDDINEGDILVDTDTFSNYQSSVFIVRCGNILYPLPNHDLNIDFYPSVVQIRYNSSTSRSNIFQLDNSFTNNMIIEVSKEFTRFVPSRERIIVSERFKTHFIERLKSTRGTFCHVFQEIATTDDASVINNIFRRLSKQYLLTNRRVTDAIFKSAEKNKHSPLRKFKVCSVPGASAKYISYRKLREESVYRYAMYSNVKPIRLAFVESSVKTHTIKPYKLHKLNVEGIITNTLMRYTLDDVKAAIGIVLGNNVEIIPLDDSYFITRNGVKVSRNNTHQDGADDGSTVLRIFDNGEFNKFVCPHNSGSELIINRRVEGKTDGPRKTIVINGTLKTCTKRSTEISLLLDALKTQYRVVCTTSASYKLLLNLQKHCNIDLSDVYHVNIYEIDVALRRALADVDPVQLVESCIKRLITHGSGWRADTMLNHSKRCAILKTTEISNNNDILRSIVEICERKHSDNLYHSNSLTRGVFEVLRGNTLTDRRYFNELFDRYSVARNANVAYKLVFDLINIPVKNYNEVNALCVILRQYLQSWNESSTDIPRRQRKLMLDIAKLEFEPFKLMVKNAKILSK